MSEAKATAGRLTTRAAWAELARWWDNAARCTCGCGRMVAAPNAAGLCSTLGLMRFRGLIAPAQEDQMLAAIPSRGPVYVEGVRPFVWPTDTDGAKARAEFCRDQAGRA